MSGIKQHLLRSTKPAAEIDIDRFFEKLSHRSSHRAKKFQARRWREIKRYEDNEDYSSNR